jgi:phosphomannomutase/phosphoglucomutase
MWKTGHSLIKAKIKETHAALAGEMSGHIFFADRYFGYDDAIYAGARFLEIDSLVHEPVSSLLADLPKSFSTPEIRVDCDDLVKFKLVESLKSELKKSHEINDIDGVRVNFGNAWALVRASNTQPVIVMRFEADSQERLDEVRSLIEDASRRAGLVI